MGECNNSLAMSTDLRNKLRQITPISGHIIYVLRGLAGKYAGLAKRAGRNLWTKNDDQHLVCSYIPV
jgi:hypothetical protein